ncbi:hypothetical protein ANO11243_002660 [Dothideomycetidae sp. 11243]|nr:hypothetical protein ANO11243_002660 [fungal sp. No.11243]
MPEDARVGAVTSWYIWKPRLHDWRALLAGGSRRQTRAAEDAAAAMQDQEPAICKCWARVARGSDEKEDEKEAQEGEEETATAVLHWLMRCGRGPDGVRPANAFAIAADHSPDLHPFLAGDIPPLSMPWMLAKHSKIWFNRRMLASDHPPLIGARRAAMRVFSAPGDCIVSQRLAAHSLSPVALESM